MARIAEKLGEKPATVHSWKRRDQWEEAKPLDKVESVTEARLIQLITKDEKEGRDYKEIDLLSRQMERYARINRYNNGGNEADLNPKVANRNSGPRKPPAKNEFSPEQAKQLRECFFDTIFDYQSLWYDAGNKHRIRSVLKSRQIGATWYFAREALLDAIETGRNQIFLSASKSQAYVFRHYIIEFAKEVGIDLKGDPMVLPNGATLYFLGTNSRTAQSYHGNLYLDEFFWIPRFQELRKVASGMAAHKQWRQTYFSTPSSVTHEAYPFWTGELFNRNRPKDQRIALDVSASSLSGGRLCEDGQWRQVVSLMDAMAGGCNLFDLDQLRLEYSPVEFENLFMCEFIDDSMSVFPLADLQRCMVDSWTEWKDYKPLGMRPLGHRPVWIGYDPSSTGDAAALAVVAPPAVDGGKFRVIERHQFHGSDFAAQAEFIRQVTLRYNVAYIGIDMTGLGLGVYQIVKTFFPAVQGFQYSPSVKQALVMKAQDVIRNGRLEFDSGWVDLARAFMAIRKTMTPSGSQVTYTANRSAETSHADLAWATMHAIHNEPLEGVSSTSKSIMELSR